ncbi:G2/mitotic-specific cyclin-B2-like [Anthonomus grandis grandis]|uniref:G2/mitotic-specific cyclin-B2-like n=1 Tax=Anthonomus grandis grandis TaxID=2921223 RepID=UPI00216504A3|nr:G2/mitotic-specific cyclin-B2-like [Anthonomus grandis grandis]XP_050307215.1 G2/mitotic-specific cyclin-B2-like [Anthonomus grandis grandis]
MSIVPSRHELRKENQENIHPHLALKEDGVKQNIVRRGALGELGNQLKDLHPEKVNNDKATKPKEKVAVQLGGIKKVDNIACKENLERKTVREKPNKESDESPDSNDYTHDIMKYMQQLELDFPIKKRFLTGTKVTASMRAKLVNWLVDVHKSFGMDHDTLFLAISVADRYLQVNRTVDRTQYQLVGTAALMLAGKFIDVYPPSLEDYLYVCNDAFNKKQLLQMEVSLIKSLDFRLGFSIPIFFLRRYCKLAEVTLEEYQLSKYILELALLEYSVAHVRPSIQAAAAVCLAQAIFNDSMTPGLTYWTPVFERVTSYTYADFKHVLHEFACIVNRAKTAKDNVVREKYASSKLMKISTNLRLQGKLIKKYAAIPVKHEMF